MTPAAVSLAFISGLVALTLPVDASDRVTLPDLPRMMRDIRILSHPDFAGRQSGSEGGRRSAEYVADHFEHLGLTPAGHRRMGTERTAWEQTGPVTVTQIKAPATLAFSFPDAQAPGAIVPQLGSQFLPVLDSPSINLTAPLVFVGYGIADPARGWDEYEGVAVRGRVVMFLRGKPPHYPLHVRHAEKERIAREKGAVGFITFTGPMLSRYAVRRGMGHQPLAFYTNAGDDRPLPGVWISGETGAAIFHAQALSVTDVQTTLNNDRVVQSKALKSLVHMQWTSQRQAGSLVNVLGVIPGRDPVLKNDVVILGAHRDQLRQPGGPALSRCRRQRVGDGRVVGTRTHFEKRSVAQANDPVRIVQRGRTEPAGINLVRSASHAPLGEHRRHDQRGSRGPRQRQTHRGGRQHV